MAKYLDNLPTFLFDGSSSGSGLNYINRLIEERKMINNKLFWYGNMAGAVLGWIFIFTGAITSLPGNVHTVWIIITLIWGLCHPIELAVSLPLAKKAGFSLLKTIIYTLVFGITWWIPVKLGVLTPESQF